MKNKIVKILGKLHANIYIDVIALSILVLNIGLSINFMNSNYFCDSDLKANETSAQTLKIANVGYASVNKLAAKISASDKIIAGLSDKLHGSALDDITPAGKDLSYEDAINVLRETYDRDIADGHYDPFVTDADNDGVSDYLEVVSGTVPTNPYTVDVTGKYNDSEALTLGISFGEELIDGEIRFNERSFPTSQHDSVFVVEGGIVNGGECDLQFVAKSSTNESYALGSTKSDERGLFYFVNESYIPNGEYIIYAYCSDASGKISSSEGHNVVIGSPNDLDIPINITEFSGIKFERELRKLLSSSTDSAPIRIDPALLMANSLTLTEQLKSGGVKLVDPTTPQVYSIPFSGNIFALGIMRPDMRILAYWDNTAQVSHISSNARNGLFYLTPTEPLGIGEHKLLIYAYDPEDPALKSKPLMIEFEVRSTEVNLFAIGIGLVLVLIAGAGLFVVFRRKHKKVKHRKRNAKAKKRKKIKHKRK